MDQSLNIKYRILHVDENEHSVLVRYWTDEITEDSLATEFDHDAICRTEDGYPTRCRTDVNLTIYQENATKEDIINLIQRSAPTEWFKLKSRKPSEHLKTLHKHHDSFTHTPVVPSKVDEKGMSEEEIDAFLETRVKTKKKKK